MEFTTTLSRQNIERLLHEFAPIRIHMTPTDEDRRWIELEPPRSLEMVPNRGVRILTSGRVRYTVAGVRLPIRIRSLRALLVPTVVQSDDAGHRLAFAIDIEAGDLVGIPDFIDHLIVRRVNRALNPRDTRMVWAFGQTLKRSFEMPERLEPLDRLHLGVDDGWVTVDEEKVVFRVELDAGLSRHAERPVEGAARPIATPDTSSD